MTVKDTYNYIGCDYYAGHTEHLVIAMAHGVTADSYGDTYLDGNQVVILAKSADTGEHYGFLAVATGEVMGTAGEYWPAYHKPESPANGIVPVTQIHVIPAELLGRLGQRGCATAVRPAVATYLLRKG